jgi:glycosyltransferase involved in cell wall biosynthesis
MSEESIQITFLIPIATHLHVHPDLENWIRAPALQGHEVILIIDEVEGVGTRSSTIELIGRIENSRLPNVLVERTQAGNPGASRNQGLKAAKGQWIFFWDADDVPQLENAIALVHDANVSGADIGIGRFSISGNSGSVVGTSWFDIYKWPGLWRFTFKSQLIDAVSFEEWGWCEDQKFLVQALEVSRSIFRGKDIVYTYTLNSPGSLTTIRDNWPSLRFFLEFLKRYESQQRRSLLPILFHLKTVMGLTRYASASQTARELVYLVKVLILNRPNLWPKLVNHAQGGSRL